MKALLITLLLALPLALSAASKDEEVNPPLKQSDLPLPVIVDPSQWDVPVTLDGEIVTVDPLTREFTSEDYCGYAHDGTISSNLDIPIFEYYLQCDYVEEITASVSVPMTGGVGFLLKLETAIFPYRTPPLMVLNVTPGVARAERTIRFDTPMKAAGASVRFSLGQLTASIPLQYPITWDITYRGYNE